MSGYRTIVADPPWDQGKMGSWATSFGRADPHFGPRTDLPYKPMTLEAIQALPVTELAEPDAHLYVWTTNRYVEDTYGIVRAWGFKPSTLLVWAKTPMGLGPGGAYALTTEFVLFAVRGTCAPLRRHSSSWFNLPRPRRHGACHSNKPDAFLDVVEQVSPGPYLELFARRARFGWDYAGDGSLGTVDVPGLRAPGVAA